MHAVHVTECLVDWGIFVRLPYGQRGMMRRKVITQNDNVWRCWFEYFHWFRCGPCDWSPCPQDIILTNIMELWFIALLIDVTKGKWNYREPPSETQQSRINSAEFTSSSETAATAFSVEDACRHLNRFKVNVRVTRWEQRKMRRGEWRGERKCLNENSPVRRGF